jgi:TctA family transporter
MPHVGRRRPVGSCEERLGYSPAALVLALVLGPLGERALRQSPIG